MSKVDAQRAMREARYARTKASGPSRREAAAAAAAGAGPAAPAAPASTSTPTPTKTPAPAPVAAAGAPEGGRCGHTSMNGRACTRVAGHTEKSHRYS